MFKPLKGIKVLDLTSVLAGPYSTYQLALLGAEVIKIENLSGGDWTRVGGKDKDLVKNSMGTSFLIQNSDKKSIQLDLKSDKGKEIALSLIKSVDVFENSKRYISCKAYILSNSVFASDCLALVTIFCNGETDNPTNIPAIIM